MSTIVTRATKGSALTWTEGDANITNLNNDKIEDIVEDTSPQLGGDLDVNGHVITSASNGNIAITPNGSGNIQLTPATGKITLGATDWPAGPGSAGQVLTTAGGTGVLSWETPAAGGGDLVDDTTPQLGGDLDVNGHAIVSASNGNIAITPNGSGNIQLTPATGKITLGALDFPTGMGTNGQVLTTNGSSTMSWTTVSGGATNLDGLSDVVITAAAANDVLIYNGTNWVDLAASFVTVGNATTASYASAVTLTADNTTNTTNYLTFVNAATGNEDIRTDTSLTYNPSTNTLTAGTFSGAHNGTVGATTPNAGTFTNLTASTAGSYITLGASTGGGLTTISSSTPGTINNMSIGATTASTGRFTALTLTSTVNAGGSNGTSGQVLQSTGTGVQWATASGGGNSIILIHSGQEYITIGTTGTSENWTLASTGGVSGVSVSTNTFTLPAGTYFFELPYTFSNATTGYDFRLRNVTDSVDVGLVTSNQVSFSGVNKYVYWTYQTHFTIAASKTFNIKTNSGSFQANMGYTSGGKYTVKITKYA